MMAIGGGGNPTAGRQKSLRQSAASADAGHDGALPVIGDIYICQGVAKRNAARLGISLENELARLVVHGTLHMLGLEHPAGEARFSSLMWRKQERILESLH